MKYKDRCYEQQNESIWPLLDGTPRGGGSLRFAGPTFEHQFKNFPKLVTPFNSFFTGLKVVI